MRLIDEAKLRILRREVGSSKEGLDEILAPLAEAVECWELVERLTADCGDSVELIAMSAVAGQPAWLIARGEWASGGWEFTGNTRLAALRAAVAAMDKAKVNPC